MVIRDLITTAHRASGASNANRALSSEEARDGLTLYNMTVRGWMGALIGQKVVTKPIAASVTGLVGYHYIFSSATGGTLTLPANVRAGSRIGATGKGAGALLVSASPYTIGGSGSVSISGEAAVWFFDGEGEWVLEEDKDLDDDVQFLAVVHNAIADILTLLFARDYGLPVTKEMQALFDKAELRIAQQYGGAR